MRREAGGRLESIDALRGFDMFWIVGGEGLFHALHRLGETGVLGFMAAQLHHKVWAGFAFYDLIFPLFVFLAGVSLVFSLDRTVARDGRRAAFRRILRRSVVLYLLGILYYGGLSGSWEEIRYVGVLQRIVVCYGCAGLLYLLLRLRGLVAVCVGLLLGYWALLAWVPVPGAETGSFAEGENLANYIDRLWLPGKKWDGNHDPEGLLSTLPAVATCLLGIFSARLLRAPRMTDGRKVGWLLATGTAAVLLGFLWGAQFPVVKKIWTSSYVLVAGGYSAMLLGVFYQVIEVWKLRAWALPFVWIGTNSITIYLAYAVVDFHGLAQRFVGGEIETVLGRFGPLAVTAVSLGLGLLLVRFLYRRQMFLRL